MPPRCSSNTGVRAPGWLGFRVLSHDASFVQTGIPHHQRLCLTTLAVLGLRAEWGRRQGILQTAGYRAFESEASKRLLLPVLSVIATYVCVRWCVRLESDAEAGQ